MIAVVGATGLDLPTRCTATSQREVQASGGPGLL
jgi:hypothetical protein